MEAGVTFCVPEVVCWPVQLPFAVHEVAFVEAQVRVALCPSEMLAGEIEIVAVGVGGGF